MRLLLFLFAALFLTACTHRVYEAAEVKAITREHETIAVLTPKVDYLFEDTTKRDWSLVPSKEILAEGFQRTLTDWIRERREAGDPDIIMIEPEATRQLLSETAPTDYSQMARELGVDAVLVGRLKYDTRRDYSFIFNTGPTSAPLTSRVYLNLFTPEEGLIWSYKNKGHRYLKNYDFLIREMIRYADHRFPYGSELALWVP